MNIDLFKQRIPAAVENEPMSKHTSFRIGGPARWYVVAGSSDQLVEAVRAAEEAGMPWYVFGGGSNLLVADQGYAGVMIQAANRGWRVEGASVYAESGAVTALAARQSVQAGLAGFEWAVGVPGTIGGAIYGNAGCYGGEMKDAVLSVDAYRVSDGVRMAFDRADCGFAYRESRFKHDRYVILGCTLELSPANDPAASEARMQEIMRLRKDKQPLDQSSAGCAFKNVEYADEHDLDILKRHIDDIPASMLRAKKISAGWLIDQAGMGGKRIGDIEVSQKHGNFLINRGHATAEDVIALISMVKMNVRDEFGLELQEEVQLVGF